MIIITHTGKAHLDDFVSCALTLVNATWVHMEYSIHNNQPITLEDALDEVISGTVIYRADPTAKELKDENTIILDVGGKYEPEFWNFDHHQLRRGTKESTMSLLAASIGLPNSTFDDTTKYVAGSEVYPVDSLASFLEDAFPWFRTRVAVDACGPFATAKDEEVEWDTIAKFLGPCEDTILKMFEDAEPGDRVDIVKPLAKMILRKHAAWEQVVPSVKYDHPRWSDGDFTIADFTVANPKDVEDCSDMITKHVNGVAVFHDNRGPGLTLLRLRDDPRIDFTKVKDDAEVSFAHANGFIVKTKSKDIDEALRLIKDAYISK